MKGEIDMALEQKYLNVPTRAEGYLDIMMYVPDNSVNIANISSSDVLSYSNINSLKDIRNYTNTTIATLEENLWLLHGAFVNPTPGRMYNGYISNSISNENGDFEINPTLDVELSAVSTIEYLSIVLNPAVRSGYPKQVDVVLLDSQNNEVGTFSKIISEESSLPNLIYDIHTSDIAKIKVNFIGTLFPHRRIRVSNIVFGKVITLTQDQILNSDYLDRCSYVPDSLPSRTFSFSLENYDKRYNIDNPNNEYIDLDRQTRVLIRNGYNIYGYTTDENGNPVIHNPERIREIEWDDWKELRLLNIYTNSDNTCTFETGSILDMMTDTYTQERFTNNRTVRYIVANLLNFMGLDTSIVTFSTDDKGKSYGDYIINTVLPELPVRELIQLLAFSVGATLLIKDDGTIKFANLDLTDPNSFTHHHSFTYDDFASVPKAEQLENTTKISLPKYNATIGTSEEKIQTLSVSAYNVDVSYSACVPTGAIKSEDDTSSGSVQSANLYAHRGNLVMNIPVEGVSTKVDIVGYRIDVAVTQDRTITNDTLIIDTQLIKEDPGNAIKTKYQNWYSKKFKYTMDTRGEPLVDAGDYAEIQTPFSEIGKMMKAYVLQNHITFNGAWKGDMEVIALDS